MRAQRVALSLFSFSAKYKIPTALVQPRASLSWRATTCQALLQSQCHIDVDLDLCQFSLRGANIDGSGTCHVFLQSSHIFKPAHENITFWMIWSVGASLF